MTGTLSRMRPDGDGDPPTFDTIRDYLAWMEDAATWAYARERVREPLPPSLASAAMGSYTCWQ